VNGPCRTGDFTFANSGREQLRPQKRAIPSQWKRTCQAAGKDQKRGKREVRTKIEKNRRCHSSPSSKGGKKEGIGSLATERNSGVGSAQRVKMPYYRGNLSSVGRPHARFGKENGTVLVETRGQRNSAARILSSKGTSGKEKEVSRLRLNLLQSVQGQKEGAWSICSTLSGSMGKTCSRRSGDGREKKKPRGGQRRRRGCHFFMGGSGGRTGQVSSQQREREGGF